MTEISKCIFKGGPLDGKILYLDGRMNSYFAIENTEQVPIDLKNHTNDTFKTVMYKEKIYIKNGMHYRYFVLE